MINMYIPIRLKVALLLLGLSLFICLGIFGSIKYSFRHGFINYLGQIQQEKLEDLSHSLSSDVPDLNAWQVFRSDAQAWHRFLRQYHRQNIEFNRAKNKKLEKRGLRHRLPAKDPIFLLDENSEIIFGPRNSKARKGMISGRKYDFIKAAVNIKGRPVAYVAMPPITKIRGNTDKIFFDKQNHLFLIVTLMALAFSLLIAWPASKYLISPIKQLSNALQKLSALEYSTRVRLPGKDELAHLFQDFNRLAAILEKYEQNQNQWIADISHELRTPLSILKGELEAIEDGIRPISKLSLESLGHEVDRLQSLVNDLHELALSDLGALRFEFSPVKIDALLKHIVEHGDTLLQKQNLKVNLQCIEAVEMNGDENRLYQLFNNLLQNTLRYTDMPGQLQIKMEKVLKDGGSQVLRIIWSDSEPGVSSESLQKIFSRLYRLEDSRNRKTGGSGLGLSVCKGIVEAHDGSIVAEHSPLGGLDIIISFPLDHN